MSTDTLCFELRPFPRRLARSLVGFALAGTLMAAVVWSDGMGRPYIPLAILVSSWLIPLAFALQIRRHGFDPLRRLEAGPEGLRAFYHDGHEAFRPWAGIRRLVQVEGFRHRAWAVVSDAGAIRWFGEVDRPEALADVLAARTGLQWEFESRLPEEAC